MESEPPPENTDPLLLPFLQADEEAEAQRLLAQLMAEHAQPLVREIARAKLQVVDVPSADGSGGQDAEDIHGEVVLQVLDRLRHLRACPNQSSIANFRGYVAAVAFNSCSHRLRRKYPERQRLKNKLRYLLNHDASFAVWEDANGALLCGFADWKNTRRASASQSDHEQSLPDIANLRQSAPRALLDALFSLAGRPIELEELVGLVARIWGIKDLQRLEEKEDQDEVWTRLPDPRENVAVKVEQRMYLVALWKEILELRPLQRAALLLNLHDATGQDMLPLFILVDVARWSEIADSLDMTKPEFAELWDSLPLDDATIAKRMGITRQQVINLRKSARERLARRMAKF